MADISNPHDLFFRQTMARHEVARDFVRHYLPPDVVAFLQVETLRADKDSFVDDELKQHHSDVLYHVKCRDGQDALVYLLFEHKSYPEPEVALQLLRYMMRIWEGRKHAGQKQAATILPIVIYHGRTRWNIGQQLHDWLKPPPVMAEFAPNFRYWLCDLTQYDDDELKGEAMARAGMLVLKYVFSDELRERLPQLTRLFRELSRSRTGLEYVETVLRYLTVATDKIELPDLRAAAAEAWQGGEDIMPTIAQTLREEGMQQGMLQGIELGLELKFGASALRLMPQLREVQDVAVLQAIYDGIRTTDSPDELLELLNRTQSSFENFPY